MSFEASVMVNLFQLIFIKMSEVISQICSVKGKHTGRQMKINSLGTNMNPVDIHRNVIRQT